MTDHIVQAFDTELEAITQQISELGQLAERQLTDAVWALRHASKELAESVKSQDTQMDRLAARIEEEAISLIARRQPLAVDLRHVMAAIRIAANLERAGDLASNIAKRVIAMAPHKLPDAFAEPLQRMVDLALLQLHDAGEAFAKRDAQQAQGVWEHDATIDALHTLLFQDIVEAMTDDQVPALDLAHLLFVIKNIERIGDHATNIAENVVYLVSGAAPTQDRPKQDESSSLAQLSPKR
ncbi:phosphate signaling complex protein PhoU [Xanthomonas melonis]|uniref:phosphate signaling complex protein PhoU n=1 Tax=Xanthomonas melonis TaxID=56456 RepID=UPI003EC07C35